MFDNDPQEFIRKVHNPLEDWLDPRLAATNLLQMLARYRLKDTMPLLMPYIQSSMEEYLAAAPEQRDYRKKEGIFVAVASISKVLMEKDQYKGTVEGFIRRYVFPEFQVFNL